MLTIKGLKTEFKSRNYQRIKAVDGISLSVSEGEIYGLVGESGSGKTVTALSILGLIDPPGRISGGFVRWKEQNLLSFSNKSLRKIRGSEIAMVFQSPQAALNPLYTVGDQIAGVIRMHQKLNKKDAFKEAIRLLKTVQISDAEKRAKDYPHQLSGGMCQRVMIAMALSCHPKLLIADEPTASLDVTVQAQILELLRDIRDRFQLSILLISHDMGVVAQMCDRVSVMYMGKIVETADAETVFSNPRHPYTKALLNAVPVPDPARKTRIEFNTGEPPSVFNPPAGCRFHTRCPQAFERCQEDEPVLETVATDNSSKVACWLYETTADL